MSSRLSVTALLAVLALAAATPACASEQADDEEGQTSDELRNGTETLERPEVGQLAMTSSFCTGTLIRPDVVLTAAHCVSGASGGADVTAKWSFRITTADHVVHPYSVDKYVSLLRSDDFSKISVNAWRPHDIALVHLKSAVPSNIAKPASLATRWAVPSERVAIFGYGCTDVQTHAGSGKKRKHEYAWRVGQWLGLSSSQDLCPGDSGGPLLLADQNAIMGTNSGEGATGDTFGNVPLNLDRISAALKAWNVR